jgi:hypothetical protein
MDEVAAKCYLGIAIEEVIKELSLEKRAKKIFDTYVESFKMHYEAFKTGHHDQPKVDGKLLEHFEYPIGDRETLQYYLAYGEMSMTPSSQKYLKGEFSSMLEGFSTNEGAKGKNNKRIRKSTTKQDNERGRKKRAI